MLDFFTEICSGIATVTGKQVHFVTKPDAAVMPYATVTPITDSSDETSMHDPEGSIDAVIQVRCFGSTPEQAQWMSDKIFAALTDLKPGGGYLNTLVTGDWGLAWRLCDYRGSILPSGPEEFEKQDLYRLRRGA